MVIKTEMEIRRNGSTCGALDFRLSEINSVYGGSIQSIFNAVCNIQ